MLADEVEGHLDRDQGLLARLAASPALDPQRPPTLAAGGPGAVVEDPPEEVILPAADGKPWLSRKGRRIDFAERDAANRRLGQLGEEFVVGLERSRLTLAGRDDLAGRVLWASRDLGDGLGFDVLTFDEADGGERLVEVKTTGLGKHFPFYVTDREVRCSEDVPERFQLHRVFDFGGTPRLYVLRGSLRERCRLEPVAYRAGVG